ncbi:hypothetical protein R3W88_032945 [Solanum pinnatisectum]|uniref:Uncharacterized protein n=1 Tax=Solanum pinnatisectum TaxID=50273 RepID=A0AAV9LR75_9SOLN|nr:hypothetical protein R3W88_032945 [Solanum pinnatisectum]
MARRDMIIFVTLIILLVCYPSSFEARRLLNKGTVIPSSSPSKKGHAKVVHAGQLHEFGGFNVDQSVPSPGIGN